MAGEYDDEIERQLTPAQQAKVDEFGAALKAMIEERSDVAARAIHMGILHKVGCEAPGRTVSASGGFLWTITPENALNDSIKRVSDGRGGLMLRCLECQSTTSIDSPPPAGMTTYARQRIALIPAVIDDLRTNHAKVTRQAVATTLGVDRDTLAAWIKAGWVDWDAALVGRRG